MWVAIGVPLAWIASRVSMKWVRSLAYPAFSVSLILLLATAKFGVEGLTQVLALENEAYNIRANCLDPGGIVATEAIKNIPGNRGVRMLSPEIVRACAVYLASDESSGITGQSFVATEWNKQHGFEVPYTVA